MRKVVFLLLVAVNAAVALRAQADEAGDAAADGAVPKSLETAPPAGEIQSLCCRSSAWTVEADALWLQPAHGNGVTLGRTFDVANGNTVDTLFSNDAGFDMQAGTRFRLLWQRDACTAWEGVYFGMQTWDGGSAITPDLAVAGTLADSPFTQTDKLVGGFDQGLGFHSTARLNSVEINRRRLFDHNCGASIEWLTGLRYIQWDESLTLDGLNSLPPAFEELDVRCQNQMVGLQIGAELRRNWDRWYLTAEGKAALMANIYRQRRSNMNSSGVCSRMHIPRSRRSTTTTAADAWPGPWISRSWPRFRLANISQPAADINCSISPDWPRRRRSSAALTEEATSSCTAQWPASS